MLQENVNQLFEEQTREWDLAKKNYQGLKNAQKKQFMLGDISIHLQFNAERLTSSTAKVDAKSISERKCFLCMENLPSQQKMVKFNDNYVVLVNPFPIFPKHLTIPHHTHTDQLIGGRMHDMLSLAEELPDFVVFYNGPRCGASAPDHFHFQAGNKGLMPIEKEYPHLSRTILKGTNGCRAMAIENYLRQCIVLEGNDVQILCNWFEQICSIMLNIKTDEPEPMMNILAGRWEEKWRIFIFPRKLHRPRQYFETSENQILLSPASVDLGGLLITPREEDFHKLNKSDISDIFEQVSWGKEDLDKLTTAFANQ